LRRMTAMEHTDVLVVGLGPAGSRAAAKAAGAGHRVIGLDKRREAGVPVQCAEFIPALLDQELDGLTGVTSQRVREMMTFVEDETPDIKPNFPGRMIERAKFDAALAAAAGAAGADCRFGAVVDNIAPDGKVYLKDGTIIRANVIIGADGPRSRVGRALGQINRHVVETRQITVPLVTPNESTDIFLSADIAGGYGWLFPKGNNANLGVGVAPESKDCLKPILERLHSALVAEGRVGKEILGHTGGPIPVGGMLDPIGKLGDVPVFLAGDAAGLANPVTGAGISAAVISGGLAGDAAAARLDGIAGAAADYAEELADLFKPALQRALNRRQELLTHYQTDATPTPAALRRGWIAYDEYWAA
jgi:digeranylgeranylglycerophospholipid reductase